MVSFEEGEMPNFSIRIQDLNLDDTTTQQRSTLMYTYFSGKNRCRGEYINSMRLSFRLTHRVAVDIASIGGVGAIVYWEAESALPI